MKLVIIFSIVFICSIIIILVSFNSKKEGFIPGIFTSLLNFAKNIGKGGTIYKNNWYSNKLYSDRGLQYRKLKKETETLNKHYCDGKRCSSKNNYNCPKNCDCKFQPLNISNLREDIKEAVKKKLGEKYDEYLDNVGRWPGYDETDIAYDLINNDIVMETLQQTEFTDVELDRKTGKMKIPNTI